ncbi:FAD-dependent oxidoreductase [Alkalimarinus sediminis]|uniref:FAD-dependent oxidoreductase n=1 Tax=Alkalimarinus sediminis TaxID=1632866 RepID=A0A9E8HNL7_9ALTE|nr:FAD-dependent oxidoreductase [Alkalimarinus sediminis]UZW73616.1 FAD-dependent oxidoreductase [Alkalimarinus sediminis]
MKKNIAVVGSGIAGLSVAWLLGRQHDVTLFERHEKPGMGAFNLSYKDGDIEERIDVPLRAFNTCYYKNLVAFYQQMGVEIQRTDHSASYSSDRNKSIYFGYRYVELGKRAFPVFAGLSKVNLKSVRIARDTARFLVFAKRDRQKGLTDGLSIEHYLRANQYSNTFIEEVILPSFAAICTCSYPAVKQYPAEIIIDFLASGMLFNGIWRAKRGAEDAIHRMLENCNTLHCDAEIKSIAKQDKQVKIIESNGREHLFDHVVVAVQANQAVKMISKDETEAKKLLSKIPYERSEVVVHGDIDLIPKAEDDRAPVNFLLEQKQNKPMASIWLNKIYPSLNDGSPLFQTWNPVMEPKKETVLGRSHFERPTVNLESLAAVKSLNRLQKENDRQIWYCGSYAMPGIPLLESAVQSAMFIAEQLGAEVPWVA